MITTPSLIVQSNLSIVVTQGTEPKLTTIDRWPLYPGLVNFLFVWPICLIIDLFHFIVFTTDRARSVISMTYIICRLRATMARWATRCWAWPVRRSWTGARPPWPWTSHTPGSPPPTYRHRRTAPRNSQVGGLMWNGVIQNSDELSGRWITLTDIQTPQDGPDELSGRWIILTYRHRRTALTNSLVGGFMSKR